MIKKDTSELVKEFHKNHSSQFVSAEWVKMKTNNCCQTYQAQEALLFKNNKKTQLESQSEIHKHEESDCITWYDKIFFSSLIISDLKRDTVIELDLLAAWSLDRTLGLYLDHDQDWSHEYNSMMWISEAFLKMMYKAIESILVDFTVFY